MSERKIIDNPNALITNGKQKSSIFEHEVDIEGEVVNPKTIRLRKNRFGMTGLYRYIDDSIADKGGERDE